MHVIPSGKSNGLVKVVKRPKPSLTSQTMATDGVNGEVELDGNPIESQQEQRPKFAKVYPSWQGYRIDFKLQKVYRPIATQRIGHPAEQSEEIRKARRVIWEKLAPNSSALALDILEGLQINTETLDEVRDILAAKWNRTTNHFENRWEWFRRRLKDLGFDEIQVRLLLGGEPGSEPVNPERSDNQRTNVQTQQSSSSLPAHRPIRDNRNHSHEPRPPGHKWAGPSALARMILGPKVDDYRWFMDVVRGMWPGHHFREDPIRDEERRDYLRQLGLSAEQIEALYCVRPDQLSDYPRNIRARRTPFEH